MLAASVWVALALTSAVRIWVIAGSYYWQDDYIHIWSAWNSPASEMIWQNWNGHREPASFALQWLVARTALHQWWPAAMILSIIAVATSVMFWLMLRRWGGVTPATAGAAILFCAWPATMTPQHWWSAGLETVPLLVALAVGWLLAAPTRWTPLWVGLLATGAWAFHERAAYILPVTLAIAVMFRGRRAWQENRTSWLVLAGITLAGLVVRLPGGGAARSGGGDLAGSLWQAGPGSVLRSVLGWLPFEGPGVVPTAAGLWALLVVMVWMSLLLIGLDRAPRHTVLVASVTAVFLLVEVVSFVWLRGGFAGSALAADPRFTLMTGTVLLAGLGSFDVSWRPVVAVAAGLGLVGCWSMLTVAPPPGRDWFRPLPAGVQLAATPSPPGMLGHFFFTTTEPVYELGTTRTLLQVGPQPPAFPEVSDRPMQVDSDGVLRPMTFTPLLVDDARQCGQLRIPTLEAGVRVIALNLESPGTVNGQPAAGRVYVFPPPGPVRVQVAGTCTLGLQVGIPGR